MEYAPRPEFGLIHPLLSWIDGGVAARGGGDMLVLSTPSDPVIDGSMARLRFTLRAGEAAGFALHHRSIEEEAPRAWAQEEIAEGIRGTIQAWRLWSSVHQRYEGPWSDLVYHSGRVLQSLMYQPTGAIFAAPTTSLPESEGGERNWDYRYAWVRDASLAPPDLTELRFTLLPPEVQRYRDLGRDAAVAVEAACQAALPGDSELEVAGRVAMECHRRNILPLVDLVAADSRIARYRHPLPTVNRIRRTVLVALTGRRHGLHASLTRMVSFGPPDGELAARHAAVSRVDARVNLESRPGSSLADVLMSALDQYATEGFADQWKLHHQGGLTGYAGREVFATPSAQHRLQGNQVIAWNPSITSVKSEDTVLVTDSGLEVLTRTDDWPQQRVELPVGAMDRPSLRIFA
jgi:Xaa-Pro aminopeptidase